MLQVKESDGAKFGGWIPDIPDLRDYTLENHDYRLRKAITSNRRTCHETDLSDLFPSVECQGSTMATTAYSCAGLAEYFNRKCRGKMSRVSKTFLYDVSRRMHGIEGDNGVSIRQVLKTIVQIGVPPDGCASPGRVQSIDPSFDPLLFTYVRDYRELRYLRVQAFDGRRRLDLIKSLLDLGLPCVFGMPVYSSLTDDPRIECRGTQDKVIRGVKDEVAKDEVVGGATGVLVGYKDKFRISECGALRFRSSWGQNWGESGYGWIPYRMINNNVVRDVWTMFSPEWFDKGDFPF